jgi:L-lactate dehydrogenase complex protein LldG
VTDDRSRVMARVRAALASRQRAPMPEYDVEVTRSRSAAPQGAGALPSAFAEALARAGGRAFTTSAALCAWLVEGGRRRGYCDRALVEELGPELSTGLEVTSELSRARIDDLDFGITRAVGAIAETGTIVLDDRTTSRRLASLAPWVHVALVRRSTIHRSVADALAALGDDPYVVWCTGPSKTADIEGILIQGVHGPGEQVALVL